MQFFQFRATLFAFILAVCCNTAQANALSSVEQILALDTAPPGVVFEIVSRHKDGLQVALPQVKVAIAKLHHTFPNLPIAVVTHGNEMFALQTSQHKNNPEVVSLTQSLVKDGVPVHVCGTYAARKGLSDEDFPAFVNVSASGPAQITDYIAIGYLHVKVDIPKK